MSKRWWRSKVLWLNALLAAGTVLEANLGLLRDALGVGSYMAVIGLAAACNAFLRFLTSEPIK